MKILFYLVPTSKYHVLKNVISILLNNGHEVDITINSEIDNERCD